MEGTNDLRVVEHRLFRPSTLLDDHVVEDPTSGLTHPLVQPEDSSSHADINAIVVSIHGACKRNGQPGSKASYALFFGEHSKFNTAGYLPKTFSHKSQNAHLYACQRAIEHIEDVVLEGFNGELKTVIIKTHNQYLVKCFSQYVFEWEQNGYLNANGKPVINRTGVEKVQRLLKESVVEGRAKFQFWLVTKNGNKDVVPLVREVSTIVPKYEVKNHEPWESAFYYFTDIAYTFTPAHNLCDRLGIQLRKSIPAKSPGITPAVRRLVITGEDCPKHFELLFGPRWEYAVAEEWKRIRSDVLNSARSKTTIEKMLDVGAPWYRPRAATAEEVKEGETAEGGVKLEHNVQVKAESSSERPQVDPVPSVRDLEDWVDVLTISGAASDVSDSQVMRE
ncbi:hypothetical protein BJ878DRAFT_443528 [Calycina marina]|uniref:ribonuclease H n=1 Tax=Calycina marina TaxID=1763456 RepID=A0A9P7Z0X7_9HELO|nr:hypothetical protein BJ878DRAFT_443528 [Calycina marina]